MRSPLKLCFHVGLVAKLFVVGFAFLSARPQMRVHQQHTLNRVVRCRRAVSETAKVSKQFLLFLTEASEEIAKVFFCVQP